MNILNINTSLSIGGGVTRRILDFAPYLENLGVNVMALTAEDIQQLPKGIKKNIYLPQLDNPISKQQDWMFKIENILNIYNVEVCHVHEVANINIIKYLVDKLPVVIHLHNYSWWCPGTQLFWASTNDICPLSLSWKCIPNAYIKRCNNRHPLNLFRSVTDSIDKRKLSRGNIRFIAGSQYMKDRAAQAGIPVNKISVASNGIDRNRFENVQKKPILNLEPGYILYVGRLAQSKGTVHLLKAFSQIKHLNKKLVLVGDGYYREEIEAYIEKLDLQNYVYLVGLKAGAELSWLYLNCSVVVFPSVWAEVFGNVGLEAMAASKPVVAFDVGGVSQWLENNVTGFLVARKDISKLADKIAQLIKSPHLAEKNGQSWPRTISHPFYYRTTSAKFVPSIQASD